MADLMLQGEFSKDPNKPFTTRVDEVSASFDTLMLECSDLFLALEKQDATQQAEAAESIKKKLEAFNSVCDELYKEIMRRKEKLVNAHERVPGSNKSSDLHRQIQTAGNLAQMLGEFRHFLETGKQESQQ
ncbi:hypothetical protein H310_12453 [Aphanomyces invadans]|uniref:Syntaxin N-terminal domain-containing protein n=1 Tax=Aphanomyces invadans TaxID=157072 RepID=A0A024TJZ7_9STRA|nr:hypothetical protein H310_12453 [Aphanomyces invadans]ETV93687.1 hypothetical protein H310_12453 [Aphanomyces invadans]|eukprot:XP_008877728.1 hypothetical protein H310_12453 [Aphanomyces invadans]